MRLPAAALAASLAASAAGQVLARPGWAGSGVAPEPWWRRAVLYRLDPARFQDSDGDGVGDLPGLAARLDYLQSLGIDGLLLDAAAMGGTPDAPGFDTVVRESSRRGIRLLVVLPAGDPQLVAGARRWLNAGAAGIYLAAGSAAPAETVRDLRRLADSLPGQRILAADPGVFDQGPAPPPGRSTEARPPTSPQLIATAPLRRPPTVAADPLPRQGASSLPGLIPEATTPESPQGAPPPWTPLLRSALVTASPPVDPRSAALWRTLATIELVSRGAAVIDFGAELGLATGSLTGPDATAGGAPLIPMQWTPKNRTATPPAPVERTEPAAPAQPVYGTYHPYIRPPHGVVDAAPALPRVVVSDTPSTPVVDPDTLMGFTSGELPAPPLDGARLNAAVEDTDPGSLLNFYRRLIALHHDNATVRYGTLRRFDPNAISSSAQIVAWIREAPAPSRTAHSVIVACNLGAAPLILDLNPALARMHLRPGALRELLTSSPVRLTGETTQRLQLPPYTVFIGELTP